MDMAVDATGRDNQILSGDHFGPRPDDQPRIDSRLDERVAGFANGHDSPASNANVAFDDAPIIHNHCVRDDHIEWRLFELARQWRLALAIPDDFAAAELNFFAINGEILFNFDDQVRVSQPNAIAQRRTIMAGIGLSGKPDA